MEGRQDPGTLPYRRSYYTENKGLLKPCNSLFQAPSYISKDVNKTIWYNKLMKKQTRLASLAALAGMLPMLVSAQTTLPTPGITPDSPFYFLDKLSESIQRFFTFGTTAKAKLELAFATERIAEIKALLDKQGVNAPALSSTETSLHDNFTSAANLVEQAKNSGTDVSQIAKTLGEEAAQNQDLLKQTFRDQKEVLKAKEKQFKDDLKAAQKAGEADKAAELLKELQDLKDQQIMLDQKDSENESFLRTESDRLDSEMDPENDAAHKIQSLEKEKANIIEDAKANGINLPPGEFVGFDALLAQAKASLAAGNPAKASDFVDQAEKALEKVNESSDKMQESKDQEEQNQFNSELENEQQGGPSGTGATSTESRGQESSRGNRGQGGVQEQEGGGR